MDKKREFWAIVESAGPGQSIVSLCDEPEEKPPVLIMGIEDWATVSIIPCPVTLLTLQPHVLVAMVWEVVESYMASRN